MQAPSKDKQIIRALKNASVTINDVDYPADEAYRVLSFVEGLSKNEPTLLPMMFEAGLQGQFVYDCIESPESGRAAELLMQAGLWGEQLDVGEAIHAKIVGFGKDMRGFKSHEGQVIKSSGMELVSMSGAMQPSDTFCAILSLAMMDQGAGLQFNSSLLDLKKTIAKQADEHMGMQSDLSKQPLIEGVPTPYAGADSSQHYGLVTSADIAKWMK